MGAAQLPGLLPDPSAALQRMGRWAGGAPAARVGQYGGQLSGLLVGQYASGYPKVMLRCGADTEHALIPLDDIQIHLENPLFGPERFDGQGEPGFETFAQPAAIGPEKQVFRHLLTQSTGPAQTAAALVMLNRGLDGPDIEAVMLGETLVFGGDHRHLDVIGDGAVGQPALLEVHLSVVTAGFDPALEHQHRARHRHPAKQEYR